MKKKSNNFDSKSNPIFANHSGNRCWNDANSRTNLWWKHRIMHEKFDSKYCIYFRALNQNWFNILENKKRYVLYIVVGSNDLFFSLDHENILNFSHHFFHCFWARICDRFYQFYGNRKKEELAKSSAIQNGIHVYLNSQFKRFKRYLLLKMKCKQRHINENNCHLSQYLKSRTLFLAVI